jgi:hypothetical protein
MTKKDTHSENSSLFDDLTTAYRTLFMDLPLAEARWWMGVGSEHEILDAVWTEYDALTHLASAAFEPLADAAEWPNTTKPGAGGNEGTGVTRQCDSDCHTAEAEV